MNYFVIPNYDLDHDSPPSKLPPNAPPNSSNPNVPSLNFEVTELTWENGQLSMHGLGRGAAASPPWDKSHADAATAAGTLESIVSQATTCHRGNESQVPWFDHNNHSTATDAVANLVNATGVKDVGGAACRGMCGCGANVSVSGSVTCGGCGGRDSRQIMTVDGLMSTSLWSPENTSSGGGDCYTKTSGDELDHSVRHRRSQMESGDGGKRRLGVAKSSISTKQSRAVAIHNQCERKRRDRINQKMKALQKLVPNCSKTDKASMLDEVIEYLRQLQTQVNMMNIFKNIPPMMLPFAFQQQLQMSMMAATAMPPSATPFVPMPSWDAPADRPSPPMIAPNDMMFALLNCQSQQPMTMDAYIRLAALCQQFQNLQTIFPRINYRKYVN